MNIKTLLYISVIIEIILQSLLTVCQLEEEFLNCEVFLTVFMRVPTFSV